MVNGMFAMETMKLCEELMKEGLMECWRVKKLHSFEEEESMEKVEGEVYVLEEDMEYSFYPSGDSLFSLSELFSYVCWLSVIWIFFMKLFQMITHSLSIPFPSN